MKYKIADFIVEINNKHNYLTEQCADFKFDGDDGADIVVDVSNEDICKERSLNTAQYSDGYLESVCAYRKLCLKLPPENALLLHGSVISYEDRGIIFLARSGVGKTTHTMIWKKIYGDKVKIINGDKPIIRFFDNIPFAYGTPWAGKENYYSNEKVKLTDICFLERGADNCAMKANSEEFLNFLMNQVLLPSDEKALDKTLELVESLLLKCNLWSIKCNLGDDAALVVHDRIFSEDRTCD